MTRLQLLTTLLLTVALCPLLLAGEGKPPKPVPEGNRTGWRGETMPEGMRRAEEKNVYLWSAPAGLEIQMVYVPPGGFIMGSDDGVDDEKPRHTHPMPEGYYIGQYETTFREYRAFCRATKRSGPDGRSEKACEDDHPVVLVTWYEADAFCDWVGLRLPSEPQWEKAARGTKGREYPWGGNHPSRELCRFSGTLGSHTDPVGFHPRGTSPYGTHDMAGNVWEWCADWYDSGTYQRYARGQTDSPTSGQLRVARGGSWLSNASAVRSANRGSDESGNCDGGLGFRPVKNLD
ncbi:formylglycine-generating enzyme family protein [Planctomycetota bacterium]